MSRERGAPVTVSRSADLEPVRTVEPTIVTPRSSADIQADLREKRARLDARIDELANRVDSAMRRGSLLTGLATSAVATVRRVRTPTLMAIAMTAIRVAKAVRSYRDQHRR